jgi:hypothetical protein
MTPLAMELIEDVYRKITIRSTHSFADERKAGKFLYRLVHECKFFECTEVWPLVGQLAASMLDSFEKHDRIDQRLAFLPAEQTWIEFEFPSLRGLDDVISREERINTFIALSPEQIAAAPFKHRVAFAFVGRQGSTQLADHYQISYETPHLSGPRIWRIMNYNPLPLVHSGLKPQRSLAYKNRDGMIKRFDEPTAAVDDFIAYAILALINTPRVIGQRTHWPHARIEREKLKNLKLVGKFPLRAWTEIILKVAQQDDRTGEPSEEHHLTGERCLHYCRTYLRVRLGMIEYVEGHWRGNPALGMKRSRYHLEQ